MKVLEIELETESCVCFFLYEEILLCLVHDIYMWSVHPRKERERERMCLHVCINQWLEEDQS